jgi:hypothetical protein
LLALKFKSNGPKGKIFASTLQFIPMNWFFFFLSFYCVFLYCFLYFK